MQQLLAFKGNQIEFLKIGETIYINPYHVGKILGLSDSSVRMAIGKMTDKQAVKLTNSTVKNFDNYVLPPSGRLFLTESGMYKLVFRSNKPEAEDFTNWVTDEVLPQIRKTGKYEIPKQPAQMTLREIEHERIKCVLKATGYSYYEKTYNGEPVISLKDVAYYTGIATETAIAALRKHGKYGKDYFKVDHAKMASFKDENRNVPACYTHLILVTRSGFILLAELYGIDKNVFGCFSQTESEKPVLQKPTVDELIIALNVLRYTKHNNRKCAELVNGVDEYAIKVDGAIETVRKRIGMMLTV